MKDFFTRNYEFLVVLLLVIITAETSLLAWDLHKIIAGFYFEVSL